jgi:membrane associated rhomboid family serine protease
MIPLRDNIPTAHFPIVTLVLVLINLAVFGWELTYSTEDSSNEGFDALGVTELDQKAVEYGAIPYRVLHPGADCAIGAVSSGGDRPQAQVVCRGTAEYEQAERTAEARDVTCDNGEPCPLVPVDGPAWWLTIFTSMFMHIGLLHVVGNLLFLWVFGNNIEDSMGSLRFIAFYLLSGILAVYAQSLLAPGETAPTVGASGAVAGVLGAYILLHPKARVLTLAIVPLLFTFIEIPALILLSIWFTLQAVELLGQVSAESVAGEGGVAYLAHLGGFIFGLATIKLWLKGREPPEEEALPPAAEVAT